MDIVLKFSCFFNYDALDIQMETGKNSAQLLRMEKNLQLKEIEDSLNKTKKEMTNMAVDIQGIQGVS